MSGTDENAAVKCHRVRTSLSSVNDSYTTTSALKGTREGFPTTAHSLRIVVFDLVRSVGIK